MSTKNGQKIEDIADGVIESIKRMSDLRKKTSYVAADGLLHCIVCGDPIESWQTILGRDRLLPIMCRCREDEYRRRDEQRRQEIIDDRRRACFAGERARLRTATFDTDALYHPEASKVCRAYVDRFAETLVEGDRQGKGLLLYGTVGTGKTYLAACVANALLDKGHRVMFTSFNSISNRLMADFDGKQEAMDELIRPALLVLDDLGAERDTEYMQEVVFTVIDERITSGRPMIITSNLSGDDLKHPKTVQAERIYDRVLSACLPVLVDGDSIRKRQRTSWHKTEKALLEGGES